ncbi:MULTISPECIES: hypothetical protein [Bacillus]|uniref:hypothetical protein n=1 Tax=Bacillus TaxID=1386 RepID=UPI000BB6ED75|nr:MULTISPECIES: hypothetical protein [Bacillus]
MEEIRHMLLLLSFILLFFYGLLAGLTYTSIQTQIDKMEVLEEQYIQLEESGNTPYVFKQSYIREFTTYERLQSRMQSFWMKWIFDFPDFKSP